VEAERQADVQSPWSIVMPLSCSVPRSRRLHTRIRALGTRREEASAADRSWLAALVIYEMRSKQIPFSQVPQATIAHVSPTGSVHGETHCPRRQID